jgi:hypothetical protein
MTTQSMASTRSVLFMITTSLCSKQVRDLLPYALNRHALPFPLQGRTHMFRCAQPQPFRSAYPMKDGRPRKPESHRGRLLQSHTPL